MSGRCSIRALWILNTQDDVLFSRRFPVVERRWRLACKSENEGSGRYALRPVLPTDAEVATAFAQRRDREGSVHGYGIRTKQSRQGSDSWVDDPITRHIISLSIDKEGEELLLWPLIFHIRGNFCVAVLALVEPHCLKSYDRMCNRIDCGSSVAGAESMSTLLLDLPCITGYGFLWRLPTVEYIRQVSFCCCAKWVLKRLSRHQFSAFSLMRLDLKISTTYTFCFSVRSFPCEGRL